MARFARSLSATANGAGTATVSFQPGVAARALIAEQIVINVTPATPRPQCNVYAGLGVGAPSLLGTKRAGDRGTFTGSDRIAAGSLLIIEWTGAAPGAICTANVSGYTE